MVEPGRGAGLAQNLLSHVDPVFLAEEPGDVDLLDRHMALQQGVACPPDHAETAPADALQQLVPVGHHLMGETVLGHRPRSYPPSLATMPGEFSPRQDC